MALTSGTRFGHYDVTGALGAGGMGEVYRARDTTLDRDVALKILPAWLAADADRIARFEREAKTLAALNHGNIAHIYGLERSGTTTALVLEFVDGTTLAERIAAGPVPTREALDIAMQIAAALEAAHTHGVVHRDLKPANVKLGSDGTVKVLDFGIAKVLDTRGASTPHAALTTPAMTEAGAILGTAAYMSTEQARGKRVVSAPTSGHMGACSTSCSRAVGVRRRGRHGHAARVLERDADLRVLPSDASAAVRRSLELCFEKDRGSASPTSGMCDSRWKAGSRAQRRPRPPAQRLSRRARPWVGSPPAAEAGHRDRGGDGTERSQRTGARRRLRLRRCASSCGCRAVTPATWQERDLADGRYVVFRSNRRNRRGSGYVRRRARSATLPAPRAPTSVLLGAGLSGLRSLLATS